jgi:hypothetical protein
VDVLQKAVDKSWYPLIIERAHRIAQGVIVPLRSLVGVRVRVRDLRVAQKWLYQIICFKARLEDRPSEDGVRRSSMGRDVKEITRRLRDWRLLNWRTRNVG